MMYNMKTMEFEQFGLCSVFRTIVLKHAELAKKSEIGSQLPYLEITIHVWQLGGYLVTGFTMPQPAADSVWVSV
jgi:hypothetical protein